MPRTRIKRIRDELWAQLDALPLDGAEGAVQGQRLGVNEQDDLIGGGLVHAFGVRSRKEMKRRPSGAYSPVWRSPVREAGSSRGADQVLPSSFEKMIWELWRRAFSRRRTASCFPSGLRMMPGSQTWISDDL